MQPEKSFLEWKLLNWMTGIWNSNYVLCFNFASLLTLFDCDTKQRNLRKRRKCFPNNFSAFLLEHSIWNKKWELFWPLFWIHKAEGFDIWFIYICIFFGTQFRWILGKLQVVKISTYTFCAVDSFWEPNYKNVRK